MPGDKDLNQVLAWVADIFETPAEKIRLGTKKEDIEAWDSLGVLTLLARLDEEYQILLTEEEIQQLKSVEDILDILRKRGKLGSEL